MADQQGLVYFQFEGLEELLAKLRGRDDLLGKPMKRLMTDGALTLERATKENTPVDTGRLRSGITREIDGSAIPLWGQVGTNVDYAPYVEFGTAAHWAPISATQPGGALEVWARRHGMNPAAIWWKIGIAGTKPREMFKKAFEGSQQAIQGLIDRAMQEIAAVWAK